MAKIAKILIVHCEKAKHDVASVYRVSGEKIKVVYHGNYLGRYHNNSTMTSARANLKLPQNKFIFLNFGTIQSYKGIEKSLSFFRSNKKAVLVIVGEARDEGLRKNIKQVASKQENIYTFLKYIEDEQVHLYFKAADCVLLPYADIVF